MKSNPEALSKCIPNVYCGDSQNVSRQVSSYYILPLANSLTDVVCYKYTKVSNLWGMKKEELNSLSSEMDHVGRNL
jgi:hypothetical protein